MKMIIVFNKSTVNVTFSHPPLCVILSSEAEHNQPHRRDPVGLFICPERREAMCRTVRSDPVHTPAVPALRTDNTAPNTKSCTEDSMTATNAPLT